MKAGVFVALFALLLTCAPGAKAADQYPSQRVRDIYEAPLLADPKQLWDRSSDLGRLQRQDDARLVALYVGHAQMQVILGETPPSPPTLAALLEMEKAEPEGIHKSLRERVLSLVQASVDESADASLMPPQRFVEWHNEGHGVWSDGAQHAWLRIAVVNNSHRRIGPVYIRAKIQGTADSASLICAEKKSDMIAADNTGSVVSLCNTWDARSQGHGGAVNTSRLLELMKQVDAGGATLSLNAEELGFPDEQVIIAAWGTELYPWQRGGSRAYPALGAVTCEDLGNCEQERRQKAAEKRDRLIFNPLTFVLALLLLAGVIGYFLPLVARALGVVAIVGGILAAVAIPGAGLAAFILIFVAGGGLVFGVAAVIGSFVFGKRDKKG